jgi:hypothetical protein
MSREGWWHRGLAAGVALACPGASLALVPFDITDPTPRTVVIYVDDNVDNPSSLGQNLQLAFSGTWSVSGEEGTITVAKEDAADQLDASGTPGVAANVSTAWSDLVYTIDTVTGDILGIEITGEVDLPSIGLTNRPFDMRLNTTNEDFTGPEQLPDPPDDITYTDAGFSARQFSTLDFNAWCSTVNNFFLCQKPGEPPDGEVGPPFVGPDPFAYIASTGRFNAIGPVKLELGSGVTLYIFGTFGDGQLFEVNPLPIAAPWGLILLAGLLAAGAVRQLR